MKRSRPQKTNPKSAKKMKTDKSIAPMYKNLSTNVRLIKRNADQGDLVCVLNANNYGAFLFKLSNAPNSSEFTALFDQYKINAIQCTFYPQQTEVTLSNTPATTVRAARMFTAIDYNDGDPPTSLDYLRQYDNVEVHNAVEPFSVYIPNPKFADATGALRTGYISTASPSIVHYGLKWALEELNPGSAGTYTYKVETVYYFSFKNAK